MKKALSCILVLALNLPAFEAVATEVVNTQVGVAPVPGGIAGAGILGAGALASPLGSPLSSNINPSLKTTLPSVAALTPAVRSAAPSQVLAADAARPVGRISQAMVERARKAEAAPRGLYNILVQEKAPETRFLTPPSQAMESPASSKEWGAKSFSALRGEAPTSGAAAAVSADSLTPQPSRAMGLLPAGAFQAEPKKKGIPLPAKAAGIAAGAAAIIGGAFALGFDFSSLASLNPLGFLSGLSWPAWIAVQIGISIVVQLVKSYMKSRKAKQEKAQKKAAEERASVFHDSAALDPESAGRGVEETLTSGRLAEAQIFDFTLGEFRSVPLNERLLEMIRAGEFHVSTDDTGALYLVPKISAEKPS
ncbi:MAG: hypothetical protein WC728_06520 [Elusimicrobiota bacterium]